MSNYQNPADPGGADPPVGEALGRSRGGWSTKIHLAADQRCRPLARITTGGQRHDSIAFDAVMAGIRVLRPAGRGRPRTRPDTVLADKAYSASPIRDPLRRRRIHAVIPAKANEHLARASGFDTAAYRQRNAVNDASTNSNCSARWPPATTNATTSTSAPSMSPQSKSGSATPFHDPQDRP